MIQCLVGFLGSVALRKNNDKKNIEVPLQFNNIHEPLNIFACIKFRSVYHFVISTPFRFEIFDCVDFRECLLQWDFVECENDRIAAHSCVFQFIFWE